MADYFHIVLRMKDAPKEAIFLFGDMSERELKAKFISPYKKGKSIFRDNALLDLKQVSSIQIIQTKLKKDACLEELKRTTNKAVDEINADSHRTGVVLISAGSGWEDIDIVECGEDVTSRYIHEAPGEGSSFLIRVINHPWVLTVVGGVIVVFICAYFGFN